MSTEVRKRDSMQWLREKAAEAAARAEKHALENPKKEVLPFWVDAVRGVPNGFLRSALFGAIRKGRRRYMKSEPLAALEGIEMLYTGERLDQGDLNVWESVLHMTRQHAMGEECRFTAYAILKLMGKTDTGSNRNGLHERLMRLKANAIEIQQGRYSYAGSLIDEVYRDKETHEYVIIFNPKLKKLFATDQFTQVEWSVRHALDGHQLAQWLHGFYASHAKPYPMKIETLHRLCGSEAVVMSDFSKKLHKALDALVEASMANGDGFNYEIIDGLVYIEKTASRSQLRHLAQKTPRPKRK